jgi:hypothetical protein
MISDEFARFVCRQMSRKRIGTNLAALGVFDHTEIGGRRISTTGFYPY